MEEGFVCLLQLAKCLILQNKNYDAFPYIQSGLNFSPIRYLSDILMLLFLIKFALDVVLFCKQAIIKFA